MATGAEQHSAVGVAGGKALSPSATGNRLDASTRNRIQDANLPTLPATLYSNGFKGVRLLVSRPRAVSSVDFVFNTMGREWQATSGNGICSTRSEWGERITPP